MKLSRRAAACICALTMAVSSAAVFGVSAADSESQAGPAVQAADGEPGSVKIGKVTEAEGSSLTVALGEFSGKKASGESSDNVKKGRRSGKSKVKDADAQSDAGTEEGSKAARSKKCRKEKPGETSSADPDGSEASEARSFVKAGTKHGGRSGHQGKFTENGTSETVNITDDVAVTKKGESAAASDIAVGDIVKLRYDENDKLTEVKVSAKHKHRSKVSENAEKADSSVVSGTSTDA
ncbi:MAG: hypothetical protein IKN66_05390 [Ruminococcus sp.]|nr:hypothetical protein [Ruminococcus sp.]